ncbi:MAG TPA: DEDD exonuclease domain-containing protein [Dermatophilaceae bacterium]|nr:DEDD exonuclease domain-containing protein [Dermatophilaceae bacterium]
MHAVQGALDELGTDLGDVTFVVVDLETTGGDPAVSRITEVGAVKVRGGVVLGEFQTLVNPGRHIPAFISVLTGITDAMVAGAPGIGATLPAFLDFARGGVLVAHNAPFDISFLKAAARRLDRPWPGAQVLDTAHLARQLVTSEEAANRKLATLARLFGAETTPNHRALQDARATVDVLHALIARVGNLGVRTIEELISYTSRVTPAQRRKRYLAEGLPTGPGVYLFRDAADRVLYVGTSQNVRRRVGSYFTAAEQRRRITEMVTLAASVTAVECATRLEAQVRELRLIADHEPRYNRRSQRPARRPWVKLTVEPFPRLSVVREVMADGARYAGPFASRTAALAAVDALHDAVPLRQCSRRLSRRGDPLTSACLLADLGRCGAPCRGEQSMDDYAVLTDQAAAMLTGDCRAVLATLSQRMRLLASQHRYEEARIVRDRMENLVTAAARAQRLHPLAQISELVAARQRSRGGWEIVSVRYGRLAGTTISPRGADPMPYIEAVCRSAEAVMAPPVPSPAASSEETEMILRWLDLDGVRLVTVDGAWTCPVHGAGSALLGPHHVGEALPAPRAAATVSP